ncbi:hypothetical protein C0Q70_10759 [Pomacea canaliculata]|uniref:Uncharacterized protein n=1 Tax=Pomacea canaliculata TaxID=400727 RepID=A0A2T7P443_POMCA|nr:hypothetical protein C0Q70_10759 [Pomacea canaliculata]
MAEEKSYLRPEEKSYLRRQKNPYNMPHVGRGDKCHPSHLNQQLNQLNPICVQRNMEVTTSMDHAMATAPRRAAASTATKASGFVLSYGRDWFIHRFVDVFQPPPARILRAVPVEYFNTLRST